MLTAEGISKSYKSNRRKILDSLEISINEGEFIAVMGESGSGKSTLLAVLAGILDPDEGQVLFEGKDLYKLSDEELSDIHKRKIGYVPQSNFFLKNYTILENIVEPFLDGSSEERIAYEEKAKRHLENLGIGDLADRFPHELSGGELKRAAIARALLTEPVLLIADEPTTGLDSGTGRIILEYLSKYVYSGHAVLVATHDDHVKEYAGQVFDIQKTAAGL
ncbi:MAG: ATP-binding cassette domain-containing protein [Clostridiales bacterium]|nr:ATP-binding cassette domain-containing protein [Clostridiales bacterium]